ncbi:uncharacterized protein LOC119696602 isoform X2 [Motacilla alba alba]|nr:uncharacterized protein LOC119696602 isoform X2 [Motacilla alba alba]XP_037982313.1 uncharacterized protein LOC119696602 isoform X2 [Motacilla alba alba]
MEVEARPATPEPPVLLKNYKGCAATAPGVRPAAKPKGAGGPRGAAAGSGCGAGNAPTATPAPTAIRLATGVSKASACGSLFQKAPPRRPRVQGTRGGDEGTRPPLQQYQHSEDRRRRHGDSGARAALGAQDGAAPAISLSPVPAHESEEIDAGLCTAPQEDVEEFSEVRPESPLLQLNKPSVLSSFSQSSLRPFPIFVTSCGHSVMALCLFYIVVLLKVRPPQCRAERDNPLSGPEARMLGLLPPGHGGTARALLTHVQFALGQDPQVPPCSCPASPPSPVHTLSQGCPSPGQNLTPPLLNSTPLEIAHLCLGETSLPSRQVTVPPSLVSSADLLIIPSSPVFTSLTKKLESQSCQWSPAEPSGDHCQHGVTPLTATLSA